MTAPSSAETRYLIAGDTLPMIVAILRDGAGNAVDLAGGDAVIFQAVNIDDPSVAIAALATVVKPGAPAGDVDLGRVQYKVNIIDGLVPGTYDTRWVVTFESGDQASYPNYGSDVLIVGGPLI